MTSVKHSTILFLVFALLCGYPGVSAQGSRGATGQQPPSPRISPPSPPLIQPPAPLAPLPQSTEGGSGEPMPITKSGTPQSPMHPQTSISKSNEGQSAQEAEGQISLAGCVMQNRGHYELLNSSGDRFALTGKTARLRVGSLLRCTVISCLVVRIRTDRPGRVRSGLSFQSTRPLSCHFPVIFLAEKEALESPSLLRDEKGLEEKYQVPGEIPSYRYHRRLPRYRRPRTSNPRSRL